MLSRFWVLYHTFLTQKYSDNNGLYYYNARYYDPELGTFLSPDTIVPDPTNVFDWNRYLYTRGNPLKYTDPTGHTLAVRCYFCNKELLDYSNTSGVANTTVDLAASAYCFFAGCHVDWEKDTVTGPTPEEATEAANSYALGMANPIGLVAGPGLSAGGGALNRVIQQLVKRADDWIAKYRVGGTFAAAQAAAQNGDSILPGLFRYGNDTMPVIANYERHHLWPRWLGGPEAGWAIYVQMRPTNFHTAIGGIQPEVNRQLLARTGIANLQALGQWALTHPEETVRVLREIYADLGIDFPY